MKEPKIKHLVGYLKKRRFVKKTTYTKTIPKTAFDQQHYAFQVFDYSKKKNN